MKPTLCEHRNFVANVAVNRLTSVEDGPVTGYMADVTVRCSDCNLPFRFIGLEAGYSYSIARVSADAVELRAPIEPAYVTEILGQPVTKGHA